MQSQVNSGADLIEREAVADEPIDRQIPAKNQPCRFSLQIDIGAVRSKQRPFADTDVSARHLDSFLMRSLCK
jgi:hypothetical protein